MGVIKRGILGGFAGRVANVVGSSWKGIAYMKSLPLSVANPNTAGHQTQRGAFSECVAFAKDILVPVVKPMWDRFAQQMSGYNAFVQANIGAFATAGLTTPNDLKISEGIIGAEAISVLTVADSDATVTVEWIDGTGSDNKLVTDEAYIVIFNSTDNNQKGFATGVSRDIESADVVLDAQLSTGEVVYAYLAFRRAES